jgi:hypothetical protein
MKQAEQRYPLKNKKTPPPISEAGFSFLGHMLSHFSVESSNL